MKYLKQASYTSASNNEETSDTVAKLLSEIERNGEDAVRHYNANLDGWMGEVIVSQASFDRANRILPNSVKEDLQFAHSKVHAFAKRQRDSMQEFEIELSDGLVAGQRLIPVTTAGCYVPGGRYAHAASAIMSAGTANAAGVKNVIATTPARAPDGIHPAILYALDLCKVTTTLAAGGVQGVASLAFGLFTGKPADMIVGPGNRFVAEAKRILFGQVGIDVLAGPTESLIIADDTADPDVIAADLAGQAEHGQDSPVWLITYSEAVAKAVLLKIPQVIQSLPDPARTVADSAWQNYGEVIIVADREEACSVSDAYAPEHLHVQASDLDWWLKKLQNYGSLFLGEETTVAFGDKCSGPNHILPTKKAARYTGGLSVSKFIKVLTYQRMTREATEQVAPVTARISRLEGMEGHARTADVRIEKYFPGGEYDLNGPNFDWTASEIDDEDT